jgi:hypothetical protein
MLDKIAEKFRAFAESETRDSSPLYEQLSMAIAEDPEMLTLASEAQKEQPIPNMLFAAVHYLLLQSPTSALAAYYPSMVESTKPREACYPHFLTFCRKHGDEIKELLKTRRVQTNVIKRCSYLFPSFCRIYNLAQETPLSLIEIGTSAGLNLLWDYYAYSYGDGKVYGDETSTVKIKATINGEKNPEFLQTCPPIESRIGIDLNVIDLNDSDQSLWLRALIWPEEKERIKLLAAAKKIFAEKPPQLFTGDAIDILPDVIGKIPNNTSLCIFHTHVANQLSREAKNELFEMIAKEGTKRDIYHLYNNVHPTLHLSYYQNGKIHEEPIAKVHGHGKWFEWLAS